jgi:threonine/homoserine/homoserine lactone efflux protein
LLFFLAGVVIISLSGVLMPGPMFAVTVAKGHEDSLAGVKVGIGHGVVEFPMMALIYFGFGGLFAYAPVKTTIGIVGGFMLLYMGYGMIKERSRLSEEGHSLPYNSYTAGILSTIVNPYWFLWWATVGAALVGKSIAFGITGFALMAILHWLCDLVWALVVSTSVFRTKHLWSRRVHQYVFMGCGIALVGFGAWFIESVLRGT